MSNSALRLGMIALPLATMAAVACSSFSPTAEVTEAGVDAAPIGDGGGADVGVVDPFDATTDAGVDAALCDAGPDRACNERFVFTTLGRTTGNITVPGSSFNALKAADVFCEMQAGNAGTSVVKGRRWKAYLCTTGVNAVDRIATKERRWVSVDRTLLFPDTMSLREGIPMAPLGAGGGVAWTGCMPTGAPVSNSACGDWTSETGSGVQGDAFATTPTWANNGTTSCTEPHSLYCFEDADD